MLLFLLSFREKITQRSPSSCLPNTSMCCQSGLRLSSVNCTDTTWSTSQVRNTFESCSLELLNAQLAFSFFCVRSNQGATRKDFPMSSPIVLAPVQPNVELNQNWILLVQDRAKSWRRPVSNKSTLVTWCHFITEGFQINRLFRTLAFSVMYC